jgi:hypothetical protein
VPAATQTPLPVSCCSWAPASPSCCLLSPSPASAPPCGRAVRGRQGLLAVLLELSLPSALELQPQALKKILEASYSPPGCWLHLTHTSKKICHPRGCRIPCRALHLHPSFCSILGNFTKDVAAGNSSIHSGGIFKLRCPKSWDKVAHLAVLPRTEASEMVIPVAPTETVHPGEKV